MIRATIGILAGTGRKPVALAATGVGETSFTANWEAFEGAVYYLLDVSTQEDFSTFVYENEVINAPTTSYVVIGLEDDTTYYYRLRASTEPLYLLDEWEYPDAAAAYSLRKLRHEYKGAAVEVRNDSGVHLDIGFDENGDLDTAALLAHCGSGNGTVSKWYDQSGNGRDATQTNVSEQPQIVSSGSVITKNGKPSVLFDGSDDFFIINAVFTSDVNISGFVVASSDNVATDGYIYDNSNTAQYGGGYSHRFLNTGGFRIWGQDANFNVSSGSTSNGIQYLSSRISTTTNGETNTLYQNGTQTGTNSGTPLSRDAKTTTNVGRSQLLGGYLNGEIQELIFYPSDQSSNRTGIETNINTEYQIYWDGSQTSLLNSYSGSAAAYSLRALSSSYTGALIEVRRASDNATQDIYAKYDGSLNVDALELFCSGTDGFVTNWYDQSGNGRDATQTTAINQPKIVSSGSVILENGKPAFEFDGSFDHLVLLNTAVDGSNPLNVNSDLLCSMVLRSLSSSTAYIFNNYQGSGDYNGQHTLWHQDPDGSNLTYETSYDDNSSPSVLVSTSQGLNQYLLTNTRDKGATNHIYINGASNVSQSDTASGDITSNVDWVIGARAVNTGQEMWNGRMQEIVLYPSDQSSNRTGIETNINTEYQIYWDGSQTSLLDSYSGSAAAYSLRTLNSAYTGPLVEVRNDSGEHADIYAKYDGSLNTDALLAHCGSGDGTISTWYDQSGNGNDATQTTAANQPQIVSSGSV